MLVILECRVIWSIHHDDFMLWIRTLVLKAFLVGEVLSDFRFSGKIFMHSHIDVCSMSYNILKV